MGEILLYFYVPMFPGKDFLMGQIRKIKKHEEERDRSGKKFKTRRKEWRKEKERVLFSYIHGGSHTRVFSIGWERPRATLDQENPLVWETNSLTTFVHPFHSFLHLTAWENIQSAAYNLKGLSTFRNVEILKECSFQKNQILLRENRESCKIF